MGQAKESRMLRLLCLLTVLVATSGCAGVGAVLGKVQGPQWVEAKHKLGEAKTLVMAENFAEPGMSVVDADRVSRAVTEKLREKKAINAIDADALSTLRAQKLGAFGKMSVQDIAAATGAEQILYIDLQGVAVGQSSGSDVFKGVASARIRVIDPKTAAVIYPADLRDGLPVGFESPMRRAVGKHNPETIRTEAIVGLSDRIAKLFYRWQAEDNTRDVFGEELGK
jgi:hypothetical protein